MPLIQQIKIIFKMNDVDLDAFPDCFQAHACHAMDFPDGMTQQLYDDVVQSSAWIYSGIQNSLSKKNTTWVKISMASFVADIRQVLDAAVVGSNDIKMALYSAHDTTVMPLLAAFGVWDGIWPSYASMIRFQLLQDSAQEFYVEILYNDGTPLVIPGCGTTPCPYDTFVSVSDDIIGSAAECVAKQVKKFTLFGTPVGV